MFLKMPNGYRVFFDNSISSFDERAEKVNKLVLEYNDGQWEEWFNNSWLRESEISGKTVNKSRDMLEKIATYLLRGNFKDGSIMTQDKLSKVRQKEIQISSTGCSNVANFVYGEETEDMYVVNVSETLNTSEINKDIYSMTGDDFTKRAKKDKSGKKNWKKTKAYKLDKIYSTREIDTYRVKPIMVDGKPVKAFGQVVLDAEYIKIGGRKGLISLGEKHKSTWCSVDVENEFVFDGTRYKISSELTQYAVSNTAQEINGEWNDFTNEAGMEKILCINLPDRGEIHFFDENIDEVSEYVNPLR